jgi:hypothetical protein
MKRSSPSANRGRRYQDEKETINMENYKFGSGQANDKFCYNGNERSGSA